MIRLLVAMALLSLLPLEGFAETAEEKGLAARAFRPAEQDIWQSFAIETNIRRLVDTGDGKQRRNQIDCGQQRRHITPGDPLAAIATQHQMANTGPHKILEAELVETKNGATRGRRNLALSLQFIE